MLYEVKKLCEVYNLPDVTEHRVTKESIKENVWLKARKELWKNTVRNKRIPIVPEFRKKKKNYWTFPKREARLIMSHNIGELNFKVNKKQESLKKYGNLNCIAGCDEVDSYDHVKQCARYYTQAKNYELDGTDEKLAQYLVDLDNERFKRYAHPLVYRIGRKERRRRRGVK